MPWTRLSNALATLWLKSTLLLLQVHWYHQRDLRRSKLDRVLHDFSVETTVGAPVLSERTRTIVAPPMTSFVRDLDAAHLAGGQQQFPYLLEDAAKGGTWEAYPGSISSTSTYQVQATRLDFAPLPTTSDGSKTEAEQLADWISERRQTNRAIAGMGPLPESMPSWMRAAKPATRHRSADKTATHTGSRSYQVRTAKSIGEGILKRADGDTGLGGVSSPESSSDPASRAASRPHSTRSRRSSVSFVSQTGEIHCITISYPVLAGGLVGVVVRSPIFPYAGWKRDCSKAYP